MAEELWLIAGSDSFQIQDVADRRYGVLVDGIGMPPVRHVIQRSPRQDGQTLLDTRIEPRIITVGLVELSTNRAGYWTDRQSLAEYLKQFDSLVLRKVLASGISYELDVSFLSGATGSSEDDYNTHRRRVAFQLIAHDPIWRSTTPRSLVTGLARTGDEFEFAITFPITFGSVDIDTNITLAYAGTWKSYPEIDIRGPITNPVIQNLTTGEELSLTATIDDGDVVRFDLSPLTKTVRNITDDENWIQYLSTDSDLATWHIAAAPEAAGGVNSLRVAGADAGLNTVFTVRWYDRFIAI